MAPFTLAQSMAPFTLALLSAALLLCSEAQAQLSSTFYARSCPSLQRIVRSTMAQAVSKEPRMAASILRLFFHDCFVNGCDASILLDDTATFTGEKNAFPNKNSARGYEVIDAIKSVVEAACPRTVSCADILALAARDGVSMVGGPNWKVSLGRRDASVASQSDANRNLPGPSSSLSELIASFNAKGLSARDMTALSGAHTIGRAQCTNFRSHIYDDADVDPGFAAARRWNCPASGGDANLAPFDSRTPDWFDNGYYQNLVEKKALLHSDQEVFHNGTQDAAVRRYSVNANAFAKDFAAAVVRMGAISPRGDPTEVQGGEQQVCQLEKWMNWKSSSKIGSLPEEQVTGQHWPLKACNQPLVAHTLQQWPPPEQHPSWSTGLPMLDPLSLLPSL